VHSGLTAMPGMENVTTLSEAESPKLEPIKVIWVAVDGMVAAEVST